MLFKDNLTEKQLEIVNIIGSKERNELSKKMKDVYIVTALISIFILSFAICLFLLNGNYIIPVIMLIFTVFFVVRNIKNGKANFSKLEVSSDLEIGLSLYNNSKFVKGNNKRSFIGVIILSITFVGILTFFGIQTTIGEKQVERADTTLIVETIESIENNGSNYWLYINENDYYVIPSRNVDYIDLNYDIANLKNKQVTMLVGEYNFIFDLEENGTKVLDIDIINKGIEIKNYHYKIISYILFFLDALVLAYFIYQLKEYLNNRKQEKYTIEIEEEIEKTKFVKEEILEVKTDDEIIKTYAGKGIKTFFIILAIIQLLIGLFIYYKSKQIIPIIIFGSFALVLLFLLLIICKEYEELQGTKLIQHFLFLKKKEIDIKNIKTIILRSNQGYYFLDYNNKKIMTISIFTKNANLIIERLHKYGVNVQFLG